MQKYRLLYNIDIHACDHNNNKWNIVHIDIHVECVYQFNDNMAGSTNLLP